MNKENFFHQELNFCYHKHPGGQESIFSSGNQQPSWSEEEALAFAADRHHS
jgi:hypothetical protein